MTSPRGPTLGAMTDRQECQVNKKRDTSEVTLVS